MILKKWDLRFLEMARNAASWSKDPSTKVGAIIVDDDKRVISVGYNGFPKGVRDDERLDDRQEKYKIIVTQKLTHFSIPCYPLLHSSFIQYTCSMTLSEAYITPQ